MIFLDDGNVLGAHLDAEIAASDHHAVGDTENFIEIFDGFGLFELGNYGRVFPGTAHQRLREQHIFGTADETNGNVVHAML